MSTHAIETSDPILSASGDRETPAPTGDHGLGRTLIRVADLIVLAGALALFVLLDLPLAAYLGVGAAWLLQRLVRDAAERRIVRARARGDARAFAGLTAATLVAPIWVMTLVVLVVGLTAGDDAGISGAFLAITLFTIGLAARIALRQSDDDGRGGPGA